MRCGAVNTRNMQIQMAGSKAMQARVQTMQSESTIIPISTNSALVQYIVGSETNSMRKLARRISHISIATRHTTNKQQTKKQQVSGHTPRKRQIDN